jgi:hypothetical protein
MIRYVETGIELELFLAHEYIMVFHYLKYLHTLQANNRKLQVLSFTKDLFRQGKNIIFLFLMQKLLDAKNFNLENLEGSTKFNKRRKKFTPIQKLMCDEFAYSKALSYYAK